MLDLYPRTVVGWRMSKNRDSSLVIQAPYGDGHARAPLRSLLKRESVPSQLSY